MHSTNSCRGFVALVGLLGLSGLAYAQADMQAVWDEVSEAAVYGPATIPLADQATVDIVEGTAYVPRPTADHFMNALGNTVNDQFLGLIMPVSNDAFWFVTLDYVESGYIKDGDAREWDVDELLESLREGTRADNKWREKQGFAPLEITGWIEVPHYQPDVQQLVWSAGVRAIAAEADEDETVNYNTYVLGRHGYISMDLITDAGTVDADKAYMTALLQATSFNDGKRYADFDSSTDKVAAYGLAALVGGLAAKKLGLLGLIAVGLAKAWKLLVIAAVAIGAGIKRMLGGGKAA